MVAAFDYCLHGKGGAAPSIDTAMHGLVDAAHVDHLHPDSGIAIATAADGEELTQDDLRRQGRVGAVAPARLPARPRHRRDQGAEPAGDRLHPRRPRHHRLGRHLRGGRGQLAVDHRDRRAPTSPSTPGRAVRPGARRVRRAARGRAPRQGRRAGARRSASIASPDRPMVGHFTDCRGVLDFLGARRAPAAGRARHVVPRPLPAHQGQAAGARPARHRVGRGVHRPAARSCTRRTARTTRRYYDRNATLGQPPAIRGADPLIVLVPGVGMFSFGKDKQTARVAGEFYVNAINVMRGAEGLSTYAPIDESEKFRIEYWALEEAKLQRMPKPKPLATRDRARHRRRLRHRQGHRRRSSPPRARASSSPTCRWRRRRPRAAEIGGRRRGRRRAGRRLRRAPPSQAAVDADRAGLRRARPRRQQRRAVAVASRCSRPPTPDWDLQHDVMAKGSFLGRAGRRARR